jgi:hypothetical protein
VVVVIREVVRHSRELCVHICAAEILRCHFFAGRGFHERRTAQKNRSRSLDDDRFVRHRRYICAARRARAHYGGNLRNALCGQAGLVEEDAAEMFAIGKDIRLQRQKRAS